MPSARECIKCGIHLQRKRIESVEVDICPKCGGLWLDRGEIQQLAQLPAAHLSTLNRLMDSADPRWDEAPPAESGPPYRSTVQQEGHPSHDPLYSPCPACGGKLAQASIGAVLIERCIGCEGLFLDKGELEKAMAVMDSATTEVATILAIARSVTTRGSIGD